MFDIIDRWAMCDCGNKPKKFKEGVVDIAEEVIEFIKNPSYNEASDIIFCIGRLIGGMFNKVYISIPGGQATLNKIRNRMLEYGCVRSRRHLINGRCSSLKGGIN